MSKVDARWELNPEIKKLLDEVAPLTLLTINGDIPDRQTGLKLTAQYNIDGIWIRRGIFSWIPGASELRNNLVNAKSNK